MRAAEMARRGASAKEPFSSAREGQRGHHPAPLRAGVTLHVPVADANGFSGSMCAHEVHGVRRAWAVARQRGAAPGSSRRPRASTSPCTRRARGPRAGPTASRADAFVHELGVLYSLCRNGEELFRLTDAADSLFVCDYAPERYDALVARLLGGTADGAAAVTPALPARSPDRYAFGDWPSRADKQSWTDDDYADWCRGARDEAAQERWLSTIEAHLSRLHSYFKTVYGARASGLARLETTQLSYFWDHVPGRGEFAVSWGTVRCSALGLMRPRQLFASIDDVSFDPGAITEPMVQFCEAQLASGACLPLVPCAPDVGWRAYLREVYKRTPAAGRLFRVAPSRRAERPAGARRHRRQRHDAQPSRQRCSL